jgi:hypothetical protein
MQEKWEYESGARKYPARTGPDPSDDFSQDAAGNKPPGKGRGISEKVDTEKKRTRHEKEGSPEPDHVNPPPRNTREAPVPNPTAK